MIAHYAAKFASGKIEVRVLLAFVVLVQLHYVMGVQMVVNFALTSTIAYLAKIK